MEQMEQWKYIWAQVQSDHRNCPVKAEDTTQQIKMICPVNGEKIRFHFANYYGVQDVYLNEVSLTLIKHDRIENPIVKPLTFGGERSINLKMGEGIYCDELDEEIHQKDELVISIYLEKKTMVTSRTSFYSNLFVQTAIHKGNTCHFPVQKMFVCKPETTVYFLDAAEICSKEKICTVTAFGDSITQQGHWTGALQKLCEERTNGHISLYNCGIGGNRLLHDTPQQNIYFQAFGEAGQKRFEKHVFENSVKPDVICILEGVNDISHPCYIAPASETVTSKEIIDSYRNLLHVCRKHEVKTVIATILPFKNYSDGWNPLVERMRQELNEWIRNTKEFDAVVDGDAVMKDSKIPEMLAKAYDRCDGLHINEEGGRRMAQLFYDKLINIFENCVLS